MIGGGLCSCRKDDLNEANCKQWLPIFDGKDARIFVWQLIWHETAAAWNSEFAERMVEKSGST
jgi:hypothetical protein